MEKSTKYATSIKTDRESFGTDFLVIVYVQSKIINV